MVWTLRASDVTEISDRNREAVPYVLPGPPVAGDVVIIISRYNFEALRSGDPIVGQGFETFFAPDEGASFQLYYRVQDEASGTTIDIEPSGSFDPIPVRLVTQVWSGGLYTGDSVADTAAILDFLDTSLTFGEAPQPPTPDPITVDFGGGRNFVTALTFARSAPPVPPPDYGSFTFYNIGRLNLGFTGIASRTQPQPGTFVPGPFDVTNTQIGWLCMAFVLRPNAPTPTGIIVEGVRDGERSANPQLLAAIGVPSVSDGERVFTPEFYRHVEPEPGRDGESAPNPDVLAHLELQGVRDGEQAPNPDAVVAVGVDPVSDGERAFTPQLVHRLGLPGVGDGERANSPELSAQLYIETVRDGEQAPNPDLVTAITIPAVGDGEQTSTPQLVGRVSVPQVGDAEQAFDPEIFQHADVGVARDGERVVSPQIFTAVVLPGVSEGEQTSTPQFARRVQVVEVADGERASDPDIVTVIDIETVRDGERVTNPDIATVLALPAVRDAERAFTPQFVHRVGVTAVRDGEAAANPELRAKLEIAPAVDTEAAFFPDFAPKLYVDTAFDGERAPGPFVRNTASPGMFPTPYWARNYFTSSYWPGGIGTPFYDTGGMFEPGYWPPTYFAARYWPGGFGGPAPAPADEPGSGIVWRGPAPQQYVEDFEGEEWRERQRRRRKRKSAAAVVEEPFDAPAAADLEAVEVTRGPDLEAVAAQLQKNIFTEKMSAESADLRQRIEDAIKKENEEADIAALITLGLL